jgi:NTP pyrophosphatase (non-canonical NTP hydrolase)
MPPTPEPAPRSETSPFEAILRDIRTFVRERDWEQFHSPRTLAAAVAVEAGELLGPFRWLDDDGSRELVRDPAKRAAVAAEIADVLILTLELADLCGIEPGEAIRAKLARNAERYPIEKSKGRSAKYDEL